MGHMNHVRTCGTALCPIRHEQLLTMNYHVLDCHPRPHCSTEQAVHAVCAVPATLDVLPTARPGKTYRDGVWRILCAQAAFAPSLYVGGARGALGGGQSKDSLGSPAPGEGRQWEAPAEASSS